MRKRNNLSNNLRKTNNIWTSSGIIFILICFIANRFENTLVFDIVLVIGALIVLMVNIRTKNISINTRNSILDVFDDLDKKMNQIKVGDFEMKPTDSGLFDSKKIEDTILETALHFEQQQKEIENRNWLKSGLNTVFEATNSADNIHDLTKKILSSLVEILQVDVGTLYINKGIVHNDDESKVILSATYAINASDVPFEIRKGQGVIGEVLEQRKTIHSKNVATDFLNIKSSIGDGKSKESITFPVFHHDVLAGIIELGSFTDFKPVELTFIREVSGSIGILIFGMLEKQRTQELSLEIQNQIAAINRSNATIEFDMSGNILTANAIFLEMMGYKKEEVLGCHHSMFSEKGELSKKTNEALWRQLNNGRFLSGEFRKLSKKGNEIWLRATYSPILDNKGVPYKVLKIALDVTEQKQQQEKSERLSVEINNQINAINRSNASIEFDLEGNILNANGLYLKMMEYTLDELVGKNHTILMDQKSIESSDYQNFWMILTEGEYMSGEYKHFNKNGEEVWVQATYCPILDKNGKPYKILKIAIDITDQKLQQEITEELSIELNNQLNAIGMSNATLEFDMEGYITDANQQYLDLMGYTLDEVKGQNHGMFIPDEIKSDSSYNKYWNKLREGKFFSGEFKQVTKDGDDVWIYGSYNPLIGKDKKPYKVLKIAMDITKRKKAEIELIRQKEELAAQEEELRIFNKELKLQTEKLTASEEELRVQQEELAEANIKLEEKTQELVTNNDLISEKNADLERAKLVLDLKAKELEASSKFKSEFLANMSHELRTPLNSILILSKLLTDNKSQNLTDKQIEFASVINKSGTDLLKLINEVLDLAKVESGKIELEIREHSIMDFGDDMNQMFMAISKEKNIDFEIEYGDQMPNSFITDSHRLSQIVRNLLSNAFKFTSEGGKVSLNFNGIKPKPTFTSDKLLNAKTVLEIAVSDTGIGIESENIKSIFEAFKQADGSTQRKFGGTGLGLSISRELAILLGGTILVESIAGEGSTFSVYIPFDYYGGKDSKEAKSDVEEIEINLPEEAEIDEAINSEQGDELSLQSIDEFEQVVEDDREDFSKYSQSVLIVEDDLQFSKVLLEFARERGFKGIVANQGAMALSYIQHFRPKAIILDINLPIVNGWTILKKLKASKFSHIPVHVISGEDKKELGLKMGAIDYLIKPISEEILNQTFRKLEEIIEDSIKNILIVEDNSEQNIALRELISSNDLSSQAAHSGKEALEKIDSESFEMIILDLGLPDMDGIELLRQLREKGNHIPVIIFTGQELNKDQLKVIEQYKGTSVVLKTDNAYDRLLEETELFIHHLNKTNTEVKRIVPHSTPLVVGHQDLTEELDGKRVLIVDDDMRNIYSLQVALESEGVNTTIATNGQEAVDIVKSEPEFDAVLMDIMMPVKDGYEATSEIREDKKNKNLPIIALTAKAMKGDREKCIEAGASDYLAKPVDTEKLMSLLKVWIN